MAAEGSENENSHGRVRRGCRYYISCKLTMSRRTTRIKSTIPTFEYTIMEFLDGKHQTCASILTKFPRIKV